MVQDIKERGGVNRPKEAREKGLKRGFGIGAAV